MSVQAKPGTMGTYYPGANKNDYPDLRPDSELEFALFGLARQKVWPTWVLPKEQMPLLDLGPGAKLIVGARRLDWPEYNFDAWIRPDMYSGDKPYYWGSNVLSEYKDNSIGGVFAVHVLEHLYDPRPIIAEVARVLAPGCPFNIVVPDADSTVYKQDVDHKTAFCLDTWKTLLDNGGYYDNHSPTRLRLGTNFKFAIKEGNEIIVTQLIKE